MVYSRQCRRAREEGAAHANREVKMKLNTHPSRHRE